MYLSYKGTFGINEILNMGVFIEIHWDCRNLWTISNLQQEIHSHEGKILKVRLVKNKAFLKRTLKGPNTYYEIA
jgi:hypothetical protein